jgi:predicted nucleic acid-binding protein
VFEDPAIAPIRALAATGGVAIILDPACADELERALAYPFRGVIAAPEVRAALFATVRSVVHWCDATPAAHAHALALPACRDPDDQKFLELARDGAADWLVTRDKALLACGRGRLRPLPFRIGTPQQFLEGYQAMA